MYKYRRTSVDLYALIFILQRYKSTATEVDAPNGFGGNE